MKPGLSGRRQGILFAFWVFLSGLFILFHFSKNEATPSPSEFIRATKKEDARNQQAFRRLEIYLQAQAQRAAAIKIRLKFRMDYAGRLWILEENPLFGPRIACLDGGAVEEACWLKNLFFPPFAHSFNLAFTPANEPFLTWVESKEQDLLKVLGPWTAQSIILASGPAFSITSPSVCANRAGTLWVFWSQAVEGVDRIFGCQVAGFKINPAGMLFSADKFPSIWPYAQSDAFGRIWLSWAAYDGHDYEIFLSCHDGSGWSSAEKITNNNNPDFFPGFVSLSPADLGLFWLESTKEKSRIWFTRVLGNSRETRRLLWQGPRPAAPFELFPYANRLYLWLEENSWQLLPTAAPGFWNWPTIQEENKQELPPSLFPGRDDDSYIAFGDSITAGLIKTSLDPEKYYYSGYPARLELLLKQEYGIGRVINEGLDGELTAGGLSRLPEVLNDYKARYLLLMEGFNDVVFPNISIDNIAFNLSEMVRLGQQAGVIPFLATITPRRDYVWYQNIYRERHLTLNNRIRQLAPQLRIPLVDQYQAMENYPASNGGLLSLFSVDLKHPNEKGYQLIANTWLNEIKAFPFPPKNLTVSRRDFFWETNFVRLLNSPPENQVRMAAESGSGNFLAWQVNPKIKNDSLIAGYHVYRKKSTESDSSYSLLATIYKLHYFDKQVILTIPYSYLVSTFRTDGIEGPAAGPVNR